MKNSKRAATIQLIVAVGIFGILVLYTEYSHFHYGYPQAFGDWLLAFGGSSHKGGTYTRGTVLMLVFIANLLLIVDAIKKNGK